MFRHHFRRGLNHGGQFRRSPAHRVTVGTHGRFCGVSIKGPERFSSKLVVRASLQILWSKHAATWYSTWQTVVQRGTLQTQRGFLLYTTLADAGQTQAPALLWSSVCMVGRCRWSKPIIHSGFPYGSIDADTAPFSGVHAPACRYREGNPEIPGIILKSARIVSEEHSAGRELEPSWSTRAKDDQKPA